MKEHHHHLQEGNLFHHHMHLQNPPLLGAPIKPLLHPQDKSSLDASAKLTRAKPNKRSGDANLSKGVRSHHQNSREAGMSKDMSGPEFHTKREPHAHVNLPQHLAPSVGHDIPIYPKKKTKEGMVDSQPMEEEFQGAITRDVGTKTHEGPIELVFQTQKPPSPSSAFIKENIDVLRTMIKEHGQQAKMKATPRKLAYIDSDKEAPAGKSWRTPFKNKEPTHLRSSRRLEDQSITKEKARRERYKPKGKRSEHQETSLNSKREEGSEDTCEDLNSPYKRPKPTHFTQRITRFKYHKRAKLPQNIRVYEGNKDPKDHLAFMHGHGHSKLAKNLNDKIPKTMEEMFERVRAFIRGELVTGSAEMVRPSQGDKRYIRPVWTGGYGKARNRGGPREAQRNMGGSPMGMQTARKDARFKEKGPVSLEKTWDKEDTKEICIISHERPDWCITMGTTLTANFNQLLTKVLRENMEVFAWAGSERTTIPRFIMEHQLKIYPFAKPVIYKRRPMTPDGRLVLKEEVFRWLKEGMIKKVRHPVWVFNMIPVKLANGT
nr:hypothetical protein [Tanacetum cinerariifolium]